MSSLKHNDKDNYFEFGTTNVFADLDMPDAEQRLAKAELALQINKILKQKRLKQKQAAKILGVDQAKISLLNRGRLAYFSIERLVRYLTLLNQDVEIVIKKSKRRQNHGVLRVVYA